MYINYNSKCFNPMLLIFRILPAFAILALGFVLAFIAFAFEMRTVRNIKGSKSEEEKTALGVAKAPSGKKKQKVFKGEVF